MIKSSHEKPDVLVTKLLLAGGLRHVACRISSPTKDQIRVPCSGSANS